jgi:hypothetical protein
VEGESRVTSGGLEALSSAISSLPGRLPLCALWRKGSLWAPLQERGQSPIPAVVSTLERPAQALLVGSSRLSTVFGVASNGRARDPRDMPRTPGPGSYVLCLNMLRSPTNGWDDRSPGAVWSPALMESVDRWPLASPDTQIPGGSRPAGAALRGRVRGVRTPHPRAVCRSLPAPVRAI